MQNQILNEERVKDEEAVEAQSKFTHWWDSLRAQEPVLYRQLKDNRHSSGPAHLDPTIIARAAPPWRKVSDLAGFEFSELLGKPVSLGNWTKIAQGLGWLLFDDGLTFPAKALSWEIPQNSH